MKFHKPSSTNYHWIIILLTLMSPLQGFADLYPAGFQIPEIDSAPVLHAKPTGRHVRGEQLHYSALLSMVRKEKVTGTFCRNGRAPTEGWSGASHKRCLSPFP